MGRFVLGRFSPLGRFVWDLMSWDVLSLGTFCLETFCLCTLPGPHMIRLKRFGKLVRFREDILLKLKIFT